MKTILLFVFVFISCSTHNEINTTKFEYPGLGILIESYYRDYYDYPKTVNDLIMYLDSGQIPENFDTTISKLKNNKDFITLLNEKNTLKITLEDSLIFETVHRSPCDELSYNIGFYLGNVLFFDHKNLPMKSDTVSAEIKYELKRIKVFYNKIKKEEGVNKYLILKYSPNSGLTLFCDTNIDLQKFDYFDRVEGFLLRISQRHKISTIILTTPIYYN